jgi:hypothetical protein
MLAVADESRADYDQNHADPTHPGNGFAEENDRGESSKDKTQRRERPQETDVAFGHQNYEAQEEERLKENAQENLRTDCARLNDAKNFRNGNALHIAYLRNSFFKKYNAGGLEDKSDKENQDQFDHDAI